MAAVVGATGSTGFRIARSAIINGRSSGLLLVDLGNANDFHIEENLLSLPRGYPTQNEAILVFVSHSAEQSVGGRIRGNRIVNSGLDISGSDHLIIGNDISGWAFGAGVTIDRNDTGSIGIESWDSNSTISGNLVARNGADGIDVGGRNSVVSGNTAIGNGLRIVRNVAHPVANGPQGYGYCDQSAQVHGVTGEGNRLAGMLGAMRILGDTVLGDGER